MLGDRYISSIAQGQENSLGGGRNVLYLDCSGGFTSIYCPKVIEFYTLSGMKFLMHKLYFNKFDFLKLSSRDE